MNWFERALKILNLRDHSDWEIRNKLKNKGATQEEIEDVVEQLYSYNYINDLRFVEIYIQSRVRASTDGKNLIKQKLIYQKHVSSALVESNFNKFLEQASYNHYDRIEKVVNVFSKSNDWENNPKIKNKLWTKLLSKGYSSDEISGVL